MVGVAAGTDMFLSGRPHFAHRYTSAELPTQLLRAAEFWACQHAARTATANSSSRVLKTLQVNGGTLLEIELEVALTIAGVIAVVKQGRLTEIQSGSCTASGSLAVQGIDMIKRQRKFDLYGAFRLGHGVPLLEPAPSNDPVEPVVIPKPDAPRTPGAWYPDPTRRYESRWWDGSRWTKHVAANGRTMTDPLVNAPYDGPDSLGH
jgi:hypothetical protein